jgi:caspase domain-containing protein/SH3 domain-containing protein
MCARLISILLALALLTVGAYAQGSPAETYAVTGVAADDVLNVREKPTVKSSIVQQLRPKQSGVRLTGRDRRNGRTRWVELDFGAYKGWVNGKFLRKESRAAATASKVPETDLSTGGEAVLGKRVALVIGNGSYRGGVTRLDNAPNDGRDLAQALRATGFSVIEYIDAGLAQTRQALQQFKTEARGAEIALFFFAGHGMQINGENFLLPVSAQIGRVEDVRSQTFSLSDVMEAFKEAAPSLSILVLDACRNNPATDVIAANARSRGLTGIRTRQGLARRSGLPGMMVVYSTDPDNVASDGLGRNSPFSAALLEGLQEPELEVRLMFGNVREAVVQETSGKQTPFVEEAILGRFFFKPPPEIRRELFFGNWAHEHWTLKIDTNVVSFLKPPYLGEKPDVLSQATCGGVYERTYALMPIASMKNELQNARIEKWARESVDGKSVPFMRVVCSYRTNRYYFFLANGRNMLATRFSEQDWVMLEGVYKEPE